MNKKAKTGKDSEEIMHNMLYLPTETNLPIKNIYYEKNL